MAKTKPEKKKAKRREKSIRSRVTASPSKPNEENAANLVSKATDLLQAGNPEDALILGQRALELVSTPQAAALPVLNLLGEISVNLN